MTAANATAVADYWDWADALFMGMNPYARLGNVTGEAKYHDQMFKMFSFAALPGGPYEFWNDSAGMFYRDELHKKAHPGTVPRASYVAMAWCENRNAWMLRPRNQRGAG